MTILQGNKIAQKIKNDLKKQIAKENLQLSLAVVLVGDDPASMLYVKIKEKACREIGLGFQKYHLAKKTSQVSIVKLIKKLNQKAVITGIIIQLPLPKHINTNQVLEIINPNKDVDGLTPTNLGKLLVGNPIVLPPTPAGIITLLEKYNIKLAGKNVVLVGYGKLVGKPLAAMLALANKETTLTICNAQTKNLTDFTRKADILITAAGVPNLIKAEMVKKGAVVIDASTTLLRAKGKELRAKIVGDVDFEEVKNRCSYITPPVGGIGPMTVAKLLENVVLLSGLKQQ